LAQLRSALEEHVSLAEVLAAPARAERRALYDGYQFGP
jgi:hypothetical protein